MNVSGNPISCTLSTIDYRGDHVTDCEVVIEVDPRECDRALTGGSYITPWTQKLTLRIVAQKDDVLP